MPQAYLRRWADAEGKAWCHRLLVSDSRVPIWKRHSVRGIAFHKHLYTTILAGQESDHFERWMADDFDTPGQEVIEKVVCERRLTAQDWKTLIRYAAAQDVRTPARYVETTTRWGTELQPLIQTILRRTMTDWESADEVGREKLRNERLARSDRPDFPFRITVQPDPVKGGGLLTAETIAGRQLWLASIRWLLTKTVVALYNHHWCIMRAPEGMRWLTSDDPVVRLNYKSEQEYDFGGGWGSVGSEFLLPLGPTHLLYTQIGRRHSSRINVAPELATKLQRVIAEHGHRWIFASDPISDISGLRARKVDRQLYVDEIRAWKDWHQDQTAAEMELEGMRTSHPKIRAD